MLATGFTRLLRVVTLRGTICSVNPTIADLQVFVVAISLLSFLGTRRS